MSNLVDWNNINMYITDNGDRYMRRLKRKNGFINCLHNVPELDSDNFKKLVVYKKSVDENVSKPKPNVGLKKGTKRKLESKHVYRDADYKSFMENLSEDEDCITFKFDRGDGCSKIVKYGSVFVTNDDGCCEGNGRKSKSDNVENVQGKQRGDLVVFGNGKREKVGARDNLNSVSGNEKRKVAGKMEGGVGNTNRSRVDKTKSVVQRKNNVEKAPEIHVADLVVLWNEKKEKVGVGGQLTPVLTKEKRNVMSKRECAFRSSNQSRVNRTRSIVERENNLKTISTWEPNELEMVKVDDSDGFSYQRPIVLDGGCDTGKMRKSNRSTAEEVEGPLYLTSGQRIDNVKSLMDTVAEERRIDSSRYSEHPKQNQRNNRNTQVVPRSTVETSNDISGNQKRSVVVKEEGIVETLDVLSVEKSGQMVKGRDNADNPNLRPWNKSGEKFDRYSDVKVESLCYVDKANRSNYEEVSDEHSSDVEILEMNNQGSLNVFVVTKVLDVVNEDNPSIMKSPIDDENSEFRKKLMDILKRPYDQEEYESLLVKAKDRPLKLDPEDSKLKRRRRTAEIYGKSPLDYHPAVQRKLYGARNDNARRLNILRGFMYWYERSCQEGAFEPWLDKSCLAVTPSPH